MKVFAISDLHLSANVDKPMNIFGGAWDNYWEVIQNNWKSVVSEDDIVLIAGDISWAMTLEDAKADLEEIGRLPGKKVIIRGNHDYWWNTISRVREILPRNMYAVQNDSIKFGEYIIFGSRGWACPDKEYTDDDMKIYLRETERTKLAIASALKQKTDGDKLIAMIHFPPFNVRREESNFTKLYEENNIDCVVYGHLHGKNARSDLKVNYNGITYYLTSCDLVYNNLIRIY